MSADLWLIDGRTGGTVSYAELLQRLNTSPRTFCPRLQPSSTRQVLEALVDALVSDLELTLFDSDFSQAELEALGVSRQVLEQSIPNPRVGPRSREALRDAASGRSKARLGLFTSGSTGLPKLVWQPAANLARAVRVSPKHANSVWALAYNPTHVAGIQVALQALANGCPMLDVFGLDRPGVLAALRRHAVTHISATPSFYRLLLPVEEPVPSVRSVTLGGEAADAGLLTKLAVLFPQARFHNVYASTEAGTLLVADGEVFAIAPGLEGKVRVLDGTVRVHQSLLGDFAGVVRDREWYDTGDRVEVVSTEPLRFRIVARERDWINVGGSKVNPQEVEGVLHEHPSIVQARVFGRKNSVLGHILCAEVVTRGALPAEAELREFAAGRLQPFKVPRIIRFVNELGTTRTGKLLRT